jgi:hypothetical protein
VYGLTVLFSARAEKIYQRQITKQGLSSSVVDAKTETKTQFTLDDLRVASSLPPSLSLTYWTCRSPISHCFFMRT